MVAVPYRLMIDGDWAGAAAAWADLAAPYLRAEALAHGDRAAAVEALRLLDGLGATRARPTCAPGCASAAISRVPRGPRRTTAANAAG